MKIMVIGKDEEITSPNRIWVSGNIFLKGGEKSCQGKSVVYKSVMKEVFGNNDKDTYDIGGRGGEENIKDSVAKGENPESFQHNDSKYQCKIDAHENKDMDCEITTLFTILAFPFKVFSESIKFYVLTSGLCPFFSARLTTLQRGKSHEFINHFFVVHGQLSQGGVSPDVCNIFA